MSPLPGHSSPQLQPEGLSLKWQEFHPGTSIIQNIPTWPNPSYCPVNPCADLASWVWWALPNAKPQLRVGVPCRFPWKFPCPAPHGMEKEILHPLLSECINYQGDEWCSTYVNKCVRGWSPSKVQRCFSGRRHRISWSKSCEGRGVIFMECKALWDFVGNHIYSACQKTS